MKDDGLRLKRQIITVQTRYSCTHRQKKKKNEGRLTATETTDYNCTNEIQLYSSSKKKKKKKMKDDWTATETTDYNCTNEIQLYSSSKK
jgi:hypothetical protein